MMSLISKDSLGIMEKRQIVYTFLKRIYEKEIPEVFIAEMPVKLKPLLDITAVMPQSEAAQAVRELIQFTDSIPSQDLATLEVKLAADYAQLFLSINKVPAHPSESVYLEGTMMQYSRDEVLRTYWSFGVDKVIDFTEPEDHIAVELGFMAYLCGRAAESLKNNRTTEVEKYLQGQIDFLEKHLTRWVPGLVKDIINVGQTPFYKAIGVITTEFLQMDLSATRGLLKQLK
ncbi:molecular chaperone [Chloroflexota bacterium]